MKHILLLLIFVCLGLHLRAQTVTPEIARQVAENFYYKSSEVLKSAPTKSKLKIKHTEEYMGHPVYYCFNAEESDGFILVSANYGFYPILGFSYEGSFDPDDQPPALAQLLEAYKNQVIRSIESKIVPKDQYKSIWNQ